jgi:type II secretory pathway pseudopilin PulG
MMTHARTGMTLMELVIGLAITGMMAAAGAGAFGSIIDHRRIIRESTVSTERAAALRQMIESWINEGTIQIQRGGGPRGLTRGVGAQAPTTTQTSSTAAVSAAQAIGDELTVMTTALNPSLLGAVRIRLYVDGDNNTPEKGLSIEYQPNTQTPLMRKMIDSTIDSLRVEFLDTRTNRWFAASEAATITPRAARLTLVPNPHAPPQPLLGVPMIFIIGNPNANTGLPPGR